METSANENAPLKQQPVWLKRVILGGLALIVVMAGVGFLVGRALRPHQYGGMLLDPPAPAFDFSLISAETGEPISLSDFNRDGKYVFVYFGYATCPDVCPASLGHYSQAYDLFSDKAKAHTQFVWITVDPDRDTPEILKDYVSHFRPEFMLGLIPRSAEELAEVANAYHAFYEKVDYGSDIGYLMEHSAGVMLVDPQGMERVIYSFNTPAEDIAADLNYLVKQEMK